MLLTTPTQTRAATLDGYQMRCWNSFLTGLASSAAGAGVARGASSTACGAAAGVGVGASTAARAREVLPLAVTGSLTAADVRMPPAEAPPRPRPAPPRLRACCCFNSRMRPGMLKPSMPLITCSHADTEPHASCKQQKGGSRSDSVMLTAARSREGALHKNMGKPEHHER